MTIALSEEIRIDGAQLVTFITPLGYAPNKTAEFDVNNLQQVQRALEAFIPGCHVLACEGHDWTRDPYSQGSYTSYPVEILEHLEGMRASEGCLAFATSDIARNFTIWLDGAIESGATAAVDVENLLASGLEQVRLG